MLAAENEEPWLFFCLASTQLRSAGMGGIIGLDYNVLEILFNYHDVPLWRRRGLLLDIQIIERVAVRIWNEDVKKTRRPDPAGSDPRRR